MLLLALAIAPGIAISIFFFLRDQYNREPRRQLIVSFSLGIAAFVIAVILEMVLTGSVSVFPSLPFLHTAILSYIFVALSEEWSKYIMVRYYAFRQAAFDEPFDGIIYTVMVGMGFATAENILYVYQNGIATAIMRMFISVPAHAAFAILMGYFVGLAKFLPGKQILNLMKGLLLAVFFHGSFDYFLFLRDDATVQKQVSGLLLLGGTLGVFIIAIYLSRRAVRVHEEQSKKYYGGDGSAT